MIVLDGSRTLRILTLLLAFPGLSIALDSSDLLFATPEDIHTVLSPTRLKQSRHNVPASVTVITSETLDQLHIQTIPDALRLVPGMAVATANNNIFRIDYHGTNGLLPRRMQVLIDGVPYYRSGLSVILWRELPVPIQNIDRIEVTRSPSSASYGANSFLAVVNIITKHPIDTLTTRASSTLGSQDTKSGFVSVSDTLKDRTHYQLSFSHFQDSGFPLDLEKNERVDDTLVNLWTLRSNTMLSTRSDLQITANFENAAAKSNDGDDKQLTFPVDHIEDANIAVQYSYDVSNNHSIQLLGYANRLNIDRKWRTCYATIFFSQEMRAMQEANPAYAATIAAGGVPSGGSAEDDALADAVFNRADALGPDALAPTCGIINEHYKEQPFSLQFQDTYIFNLQTRAVSGIALNRKRAYSETFLDGTASRTTQQIFGNVEWSPSDWFTVNIGGMWEREQPQSSSFEFSPRAAANLHINPFHTVRLVHSEAIRIPDMLEADRQWNYTMQFDQPLYDGRTKGLFYLNATSPNTLGSEKIRSQELGYFGQIPEMGLTWDLKFFREELKDLISEKLTFFDFKPSNDNSTTLQGAELQLEYLGNSPWRGYVSYAYLDNDSTNALERSLYARHSGAAYLHYNFNRQWRGAIAYYGSNAIDNRSFDRYDVIVSHKMTIAAEDTLNFILKFQTYGNESSGVLNNGSRLTKDTLIFLSVDYSH